MADVFGGFRRRNRFILNIHTFSGRVGRSRAADGALRGYDAVAAEILP